MTEHREQPSARLASARDTRAAGAALAAAFRTDPVWQWMMHDERRFDRRASRLHQALVRMHLPLDSVWTAAATGGAPPDGPAPSGSAVDAVGIWAPPRRYRVPTGRTLASAHLVLTPNLTSFRRILAATELDHLHPPEPHWYLAVLGTRPEREGRGLGAAVMAPAIARADAEGVGCYLESSKEANIAYYERHGFRVTGTHDLDRGRGPRLWLMWRDPMPPARDRT